MLSKCKENADREFAPVYFNSTSKTVITLKYGLNESFQEILYRIDNWISERKGYSRIGNKNNICINIFCYENDLVYPAHVSDKKFEQCMDFC